MKRTISFILLAVLLVSMVPSAFAATFVIEHESELDSLRAASASRSVIIDPIMTIDSAYDSRDSYVYDDMRSYRYSDIQRYDRDDYRECVEDAEDDFDDDDIDRDEYRDELRDCERRHRYTGDYRQSGPMRSLKWFYEWKFNPRTFVNRYCPPHLHRSPATDGPTWYEIRWTHDCTSRKTYRNYDYHRSTVSRPAYSSSYTFTHYESSAYVPRTPMTVSRPGYVRADDSVRYRFTDYRERSATVTSRPAYGSNVRWHAKTEPTLKKTYSAKAHSQLQDYCDNNRAADGSMNSWCKDRAHLWS